MASGLPLAAPYHQYVDVFEVLVGDPASSSHLSGPLLCNLDTRPGHRCTEEGGDRRDHVGDFTDVREYIHSGRASLYPAFRSGATPV